MAVKLAKVTDNIEDMRLTSPVWTMDEDDLDGHLDDVEILVDCE